MSSTVTETRYSYRCFISTARQPRSNTLSFAGVSQCGAVERGALCGPVTNRRYRAHTCPPSPGPSPSTPGTLPLDPRDPLPRDPPPPPGTGAAASGDRGQPAAHRSTTRYVRPGPCCRVSGVPVSVTLFRCLIAGVTVSPCRWHCQMSTVS